MKTSKSFKYNIKMLGCTPANRNTLDTEVVVSLNYLSNFLRSLDLPLINCEIELDLSQQQDCVISKLSRVAGITTNAEAGN